MNRNELRKISVATSAEAEEAVAEMLSGLFGQPASAYTDAETGATTVSVYCRGRIRLPPAQRAELRAGLDRIKTCGLDVEPARISIRRIRHENWAESWKRHFKPIEISGALLIKPSWSGRRPRKGQAVVVLDPGLSFGTGQHPTTAFCLQQLVKHRKRGQAQSFLDIGTGSGILAIAAAKLGYAPVHALDFDPEAVRIARANARANRVRGRISFTRQDVSQLPFRNARRYDLICANLISTVLTVERHRIVRRLRPGGVLVVAGILNSEFPQVRKAYESLGLRPVAGKCEKGWRSAAFRLQP